MTTDQRSAPRPERAGTSFPATPPRWVRWALRAALVLYTALCAFPVLRSGVPVDEAVQGRVAVLGVAAAVAAVAMTAFWRALAPSSWSGRGAASRQKATAAATGIVVAGAGQAVPAVIDPAAFPDRVTLGLASVCVVAAFVLWVGVGRERHLHAGSGEDAAGDGSGR